MTIYELAEKSGFSTATISRALDPETRSKVAPESLKKIDALIARYGYVPNSAARNLRKTSFKTIGVAVPYVDGLFNLDYFSQMMTGVSDYLLGSDYALKVIPLRRGYVEKFKNNFGRAEGVDGLIMSIWWPDFFSKTFLMDKLGVPCVAISEPRTGVRAHFISGDHLLGGRLAAQRLHEAGHRNILILGGPAVSRDAVLRSEGFQNFFKEKKGRSKLIEIRADYEEAKAREAVRRYFSAKRDVTAIFCVNDEMAYGAIDALRGLGIQCPRDISVIGYDDERRARFFTPALTTIHVPTYEMARDAAVTLLNFLKNGDRGNFFFAQRSYPVTLVERQSVAPAR